MSGRRWALPFRSYIETNKFIATPSATVTDSNEPSI